MLIIVVLFQGVALLPFVDEKRLLGALSGVYPDLTEFEGKFDSSLFTKMVTCSCLHTHVFV